MHNNFYFSRKLSQQLTLELSGYTFVSCFSQSRNELIMQFEKAGQLFNIKALLQSDFSCLFFPDEISRARRNSVNLFEEAIGLPVTKIIQFENERSFLIKLQDKGLLFKMHGNRSNILLMEKDAPIALFNNNLQKDWNLKSSELHRKLDFSRDAFNQLNGNFKKLIPTLGNLPEHYLQEKGYDQCSIDQKWELLQQTLRQLEQAEEFYIIELEGKPALSLLSTGKTMEAYQDPINALNRFFIAYTREYSLQIEKQQILQQLHKSIRSSENYLQKTGAKLHELQNSTKNREIADIIMANLHAIPTKATEVELFDFYHDRPLTIKLKKDLSPQKNAENYYRKAKNQQVEEQYLQENIRSKEDKLLELQMHVEQIEALQSLKELREYLKKNAFEQLLDDKQETLPYRSFEYEGYAIWVGKGASQNDALLRYHAHKDDLWLHAKDVSGSHVLLKRKPGHNFPLRVKERAAELAAWYSKGKNDSLCPVICTARKWVRKPKGAAAGAVLVDKEEEVLLVKPTSIQNDSH